ncbi:MAG: phosphoribosylglycinamide formyltransferase [Armatimonadetes bacterium]|nr:phosphoribosylglycinamide formyltransferase [Armatimonadota bacterium]
MSARFSVAILTGSKGRGSNLTSLIHHAQRGEIPADVNLVISPKNGTQAVETARSLNVPVVILPYKSETYAEDLMETLVEHKITLICLAGYMTLLPTLVLDAFPNRVLNIHPALLPKFGGKGMYGSHVHEAVIAAGETESGCTVHFVTEHYDEGAPVLQYPCPVWPDDTPASLAQRVIELEMKAYPAAIKKLHEDRAP